MAAEGWGPDTDLSARGRPVPEAPSEAADDAAGTNVEAPSASTASIVERADQPSTEGDVRDEPRSESRSDTTLSVQPDRSGATRTAEVGHQEPGGEFLPSHPGTLPRRLFDEGYEFDFFQAVRLLQRWEPKRVGVGREGPPQDEAVRFRARISLSFPPSSIHEIQKPTSRVPVPVMVQAFMGLTGPSSVLPRHYTELLYRIERDVRTPEKHALRDWLDLFNHRMVSLFYRAWEKYRFYIPFERGEYKGSEPEPFTSVLFSLIGLGFPALRGRVRMVAPAGVDEDDAPQERVLAQIEDLALLHFSGMLAHRPRCAVALEAMLQEHFQIRTRIEQYKAQWLKLEPPIRTRLGGALNNNAVGVSAVAGSRVWDRQSKFRVRLGPMRYARFLELLPDRAPVRERKTFFLLAKLVRLYADPGLDFDIQLVLKAEDVPRCRLAVGGTFGAHLGWNTWLLTRPASADAEDVIIDGAVAFETGL